MFCGGARCVECSTKVDYSVCSYMVMLFYLLKIQARVFSTVESRVLSLSDIYTYVLYVGQFLGSKDLRSVFVYLTESERVLQSADQRVIVSHVSLEFGSSDKKVTSKLQIRKVRIQESKHTLNQQLLSTDYFSGMKIRR